MPAGAITCGFILKLLTDASSSWKMTLLEACRAVMLLYSTIQVFQTALFCALSPAVELDAEKKKRPSPAVQTSSSVLGLHKSKWIVLKLSLLFMIDSFGGSFVLQVRVRSPHLLTASPHSFTTDQSIISGWFYRVYGTSSDTIGSMVFVCNVVAGISALFAAKLADSIGLVLTMVVTHLPSNVLLILLPLVPTEILAITVLCLRYSISQMDVPTRNAVGDCHSRSLVTHLTASPPPSLPPSLSSVRPRRGRPLRTICRERRDECSAESRGQVGSATLPPSLSTCPSVSLSCPCPCSMGPYCAGLLFDRSATRSVPFFVAGSLKILYDVLLLYSFVSLKPQCETASEDSLEDYDTEMVTSGDEATGEPSEDEREREAEVEVELPSMKS